MKRLFTLKLGIQAWLLACVLGMLGTPAAMFAQNVANHGYLEKQTSNEAVDNNSTQAIKEIDAAINELKKASIDDGKNLSDHPPVDASMEKMGRFHKAKELLDKARMDVGEKETDAGARALQGRILQHIDLAHDYVEKAMGVLHPTMGAPKK